MGKITIFIIILFLAALAVFAIYNQGITTVKIPFGEVYETPTIALVLLSIAVGAFAMLFYFMVRDTKRYCCFRGGFSESTRVLSEGMEP
jgi:uncharacterized integral membrane protein